MTTTARSLTTLCFLCALLPPPAALASSLLYRFAGDALQPEIDFTLEVDFARAGYFISASGAVTGFDPERHTIFVDYHAGSYALAATDNPFQRHYGEDTVTVEGVVGCLYALNSIAVCREVDDGTAATTGAVAAWQPGEWFDHYVFDSLGPYEYTHVRLASITTLPLPAALLLQLSGLPVLLVLGRRRLAPYP
ncbi:MAG: hypothetical protein R3F42_12515 [Pseudomonadota bacterium]